MRIQIPSEQVLLFKNFDNILAMETYVKNKNYWQRKPYIEGIEITNYKTNDANLAAIVSGQLDWSSTFVPDVEKRLLIETLKIIKCDYTRCSSSPSL